MRNWARRISAIGLIGVVGVIGSCRGVSMDGGDGLPQPQRSGVTTERNVAGKVRSLTIWGCCDSITVGEDGTSYRDELSELLKDVGVDPIYVTTAMPASPCSMWAPKISALITMNRPDVLLLNCGTNDAGLSNDQLAAFERTYAQMINDARAGGVKVMASKLQVSDTSSRPSQAWLPGNEVRINTAIDRVSKFYGDVGLADFSAIPATAANTTDGIHPSPIGEQLYANTWFAEGQRMGWW